MSVEKLLKTNVNEHTEKKNGLTYLSWAWAWAKVMEVDPAATYEVKMFPHIDNPNLHLPFQDLGGSCMVWVTVTIFGKALCVQLPVIDYRNKCISTPNAFDINTSIMRCLTKGIAMHGLGLYIYAGEDLPDEGDVRKKGSGPVITPRGGIGLDLPADQKEFLQELAQSTTDLIKAGKASEALAMIEEQKLEADQKIYLFDQLDSTVRTALKKAKN